MSTVVQESKFCHVLGKGQGYLKAGFLGFNKSGKTWTALSLALGTRKFFGMDGPIAMYDTEGGNEYIAHRVRKETGKDLVGCASRSLSDLLGMAQECERDGVSVLLADSMTHPWREVCKSYLDAVNRKRKEKKLAPRYKLEFQDWGIIKDLWAPWTDFYMNSKLHIIVCGRAGYDYDYEENEETGRNDLVKTGVKMKTEGEFGFEPSLLVEMERIQDLSGAHTKILHRAVVIGDRFGVIDGQAADDPGFDFFQKHLEMLTPGAHAPIDTRGKTVTSYDDAGDRDWNRERENRKIFCEEIQGLVAEKWPGQTADEKGARLALMEQIFNTRSWTKVEGMDSAELRRGLEDVRAILRPGPLKAEVVRAETDGPAGATLPIFTETRPVFSEAATPAAEPKPEETKKPRRPRAVKLDPDFISPREASMLVRMATRFGWTEPEFIASLPNRFGIASPDFIPVNRYEEVCEAIESGLDGTPRSGLALEEMAH